jgi:hypothetical protein
MDNFTIGYHIGNLCDALLITPIFKKIKNATLEIIDDEVARNKGCLFNDLCEVKFSKNPAPECPRTQENTHISQTMLNALNITDVNYLPIVILKDEEIEWAKDFLKNYENPIVYTPTNSCSWDPNNLFAQMRTFTLDMHKTYIDILSKKYTILQFGLSNGFYKHTRSELYSLDDVVNIPNLNLRQLAACYKVIGKGLFSDTGDPYLMTAVGGKVVEIVPMYNESIYPYWKYIYNDESLWKNEKVRNKYFCMTNWQKSIDYLNFDF